MDTRTKIDIEQVGYRKVITRTPFVPFKDGNGARQGRVSLSYTHSHKKFILIPKPKSNGYQTFVSSPSRSGNGYILVPIPVSLLFQY